jgi:hypothetical protein
VSLGFRYTRGYDLPVITDINLAGVAPASVLDDGRGVYSAIVNATNRVDPRYNRVQLVQSIGDSWYKGVTLQFTKRMTHGTQFNLNYSYAKGIDTAPLGGGTIAVQGDAGRSDPVNLLRDKAVNQLDQRHTFNGSLVAMSSVTRLNPLLNRILSDNQLGLILQFGSGLPLSITGSRDLNFDGSAGDRPLYIARNALYLPTRWNVDMRYSRFYNLGKNRRVSMEAEFKNLFNNVQESGVNTQITVDTAGYPVDPVTLVRLPLSSISQNIKDYKFNLVGVDTRNGYEQRKFQLGFKFYF